MPKWFAQLLSAASAGTAVLALLIGFSRIPLLAQPCGCGEASANALGACLFVIGAANLLYAFSLRAAMSGTSPVRGRLNFVLSGLCGLAAGAMLITLGAAYPGGPVGQTAAIAILLLAVLVLTACEHLMKRGYSAEYRLKTEKLVQRTSHVGTPLLLVWAGLAQIGLPVRFTALNFLVVLFAIAYAVATVTGALSMRSKPAD
jgi:uncharacterized membrane protein YuzA (DUF378 family)